MDWPTIKEKLQAPFTPEEIEWRVGATNSPKTQGLVFPYLTSRAIQDRLDEVFNPGNWRNAYRPWKDKAQIGIIEIWDDDRKIWIGKEDGADDSDFEPTKGGLSDAMKRAAVQWGIGRYLYKLPEMWAEIAPRGKSFVVKVEPHLPIWALPKDYIYQDKKTTTPPTPSAQIASQNTDGDNNLRTIMNPPSSTQESKCQSCNGPITKDEIEWCVKCKAKYQGKLLCRKCQRK